MCESYVQAYSKPWPSAICMSSIIRWYGGSGRTVTPKLSMVPPRWRGRGTSIPPRSSGGQMAALYFLFAFVAGAMLPFQAGINAQLAHWLHSPIRASFVSFLVGTIALLVLSGVVWR